LAVTADLYRAGSKLEEKKHNHFIQQLVNAGLSLVSGACLAVGLDAGFYGVETFRIYNDAKHGESHTQTESRWAHQRLQGDDWTGHKTFKFEGEQQLLAATEIGSKVRPDAQQFKQHLIDNHRKWPSSMSVVHTLGHGGGVQGVCGVSMKEFSGALKEAAQETGKKADVVLFESCLMGNLESMAAIADGARFAVASEKKLDFPVPKDAVEKRLLDPQHYVQLAQQEVSAEELSKQIFQAASEQPVVQHTLARYDLNEIKGGLLPAVGTLGAALDRQLSEQGSDFAKLLSDCLDNTAVVDGDFALLDLGHFLNSLENQVADLPEVKSAVTDTLREFEQSIPQSKSSELSKEQELGHMSFVDPRVYFKAPDGQPFDYNVNLPEGWQQFSKHLQTSLTELAAQDSRAH
jgi:hypothetical protein